MDGQQTLPLTVEQPLVFDPHLVLPKFDPDRQCAKCGHVSVGVLYHKGLTTWTHCYDVWLESRHLIPWSSEDFPEHFDLTCHRCHYQWCEAVL